MATLRKAHKRAAKTAVRVPKIKHVKKPTLGLFADDAASLADSSADIKPSVFSAELNNEEKIRVKKFAKKLNFVFSNPALLAEALTHRSKHSINNERMEFLGDSVLGFIIASELFYRFPDAKEGQLSRARASLVKGETLADIARELKLGDYLFLGPGELKSGGFERNSILADAMEAIFGALFLDAGLDAVKQVVLSLYESRLQAFSMKEAMKDPKTQLQEYLQSKRQPLPDYQIVATTGSDHAQTFRVTCVVAELDRPVEGKGSSRRRAEQDAAKKALQKINTRNAK